MKPTPSLGAHVLLVGHNRDGLLVRRALLEEQGFQIEIAQNGEEAMKLLDACRFDVVVTGYRMPRMSGTELIERVRKADPQARIVVVSAFVEALGLTEQNTGADAVVAKNNHESVHLVRCVKRLAYRATTRKPPRSVGQLRVARAR